LKPKESLESIKARIDSLTSEMQELEPARAKYYEISGRVYELKKELDLRSKAHAKSTVIYNTSYQEPEYPEMGTPGRNGSANFETEELANELIKALVWTNYYHGYRLEWSGPGAYVVEPSYEYDHDHEIIYTATFKKELE
jgi:hypothetical protein